MKIGILGAGNMGTALGRVWLAAGHEICFGVREAPTAKTAARLADVGSKSIAKPTLASIVEAAEFGDVVLVAVPWEATEAVVRQCAAQLADKIVIDCTNPIKPDLSGLHLGHTTSAAEEIARWAPAARVVKAFNTIGAGTVSDARFGDHSAGVFVCGDDAEANQIVSRLAEEIGLEVIEAGPLVQARYIEPLAMLWIQLAIRGNYGSKIAVKLLRR
ncbi:MAG: NADPH-dependent F420 reductase [Planctomycetota bacterium]|nr:NADPH-dependent F420 reductase [Planctomycetota bacterium]